MRVYKNKTLPKNFPIPAIFHFVFVIVVVVVVAPHDFENKIESKHQSKNASIAKSNENNNFDFDIENVVFNSSHAITECTRASAAIVAFNVLRLSFDVAQNANATAVDVHLLPTMLSLKD